MVAVLEAGAAHMQEVFLRDLGVDVISLAGGAAAGGFAAGFAALFGAEIRSGIGEVLRVTGFSGEIESADAVITGEGRFDRQSVCGKAIGGVIEAANRFGVPVFVLAGSVGDALTLVRCTDRREEARLCACEIFRAVSDGAAYSDIAVVMRNTADYEGILDRYLARCGIPHFFSVKTDAATLPLTRLILSALSLIVWDFRLADVTAYIKTGLCGLSDDACDLFEEYISRWNINGARRYLDGEDFTMARDGYTAEAVDAASTSMQSSGSLPRRLRALPTRLHTRGRCATLPPPSLTI